MSVVPASPLTTAPELAQLLVSRESRPTLLDVRWQLANGAERDAYVEAHIPSAVFVDLDEQLSAPPGPGGRHPLPSAHAFAAEMRSVGVANDRAVVVYDAASSMAAARAWWLLRYFGHRRASVLDGGLGAWTAAGYELEAGVLSAQRGDFIARSGGMPLIDADRALELTTNGILLDARAPERYHGLIEPVDPVAGHIPGARNLPTTSNLDRSGRFLDPDRLRTTFEKTGIGEGIELGVYCGSGVTAAHEVLALELAAYPAALYAGSWSEWITDPRRPVARESRGAPAGPSNNG
jgi:thiosulfate/3-mercaptopyruvate sulfurtransferase